MLTNNHDAARLLQLTQVFDFVFYHIVQTYLIKDSECLPDLLLAVCVLHLPRHHRQKLREINGPVALRRQFQKVNVCSN